MKQRGRKSAAQLAVVAPSGVQTVPRARPPADLTPEQADEWNAVVNRLPAEWFPRETHPMLAAFCRHVVAARRVAHLLKVCEQAEEFDLREYDQLLKMQEREGRAITALATKMRLSQQATARQETTRKPTMSSRPWEAE